MRLLAALLVLFAVTEPAHSDQLLFDNTVEFTGQIFFLDSKVPGLIIGAIKDGETAVYGFGETAKGSGTAPDATTRIGVGSITKTLTGLALAHLTADGTVSLSDPAKKWSADLDGLPDHDGRQIRLIDLVTHSGGLQRDLFPSEETEGGKTFPANADTLPLLYAPGEGALYSNVGFDILAVSLEGAAQQAYPDFLRERVLQPLGMENTGYDRPEADMTFKGYDWNGEPMEPPPPANRYGASRIYTTAEDLLRYLAWHLDRFGADGMEARRLSQAAWLQRDGLSPVYGLDESGHMIAMGLGWVIMMPEGDRPLILQKAGGADGVFSYIAFAPNRNVGVFIAINQFNFGAGMEMAHVVNDLIATLAPR